MPTASGDLTPSPSRPWSKENVRDETPWSSPSSGPVAKATRLLRRVEHLSCLQLRVEAGEVGAGELAHRLARRLAGVAGSCISAIVSYQTPTSALPKSGLSFSVSVLTTMHVDDLAGDLAGIEHLGRARLGLHFHGAAGSR